MPAGAGRRALMVPAKATIGGMESVHHLVPQAAAFLRAHYREQITIDDLADDLDYSPSHLTRAFTAAAGIPPIGYLAAWRLHEAKRMLVLDGAGVADTCHEVGYTSVGTFTRRFTRAVGLAPAALRRAAETLALTSLPPVTIHAPSSSRVRVRLELSSRLRESLGPAPYQWTGMFSGAAPFGPPVVGTLRRAVEEVELPVLATAPWLLALLVADDADVMSHIAPSAPLVGLHPVPVAPAESTPTITVPMAAAHAWQPPVLVALAALWPG